MIPIRLRFMLKRSLSMDERFAAKLLGRHAIHTPPSLMVCLIHWMNMKTNL